MNDTIKFFLIVGGMFLMVCLAGVVIAQTAGITSEQTGGTIRMVQPCGQIWCADKDAHYAQNVNEPNSEANLNNANANLQNARAEQVEAQTELYVEQTNNTIRNKQNWFCAGLLVPIIIIGSAGALALFFAMKEGAV